MQLSKFFITGMPPGLLMHNPLAMQLKTNNPGQLAVGGTTIPSAEEEAANSRYLTPDGKYLCVPSEGFRGALVSGGTGRKIGKRSAIAVLKGTVFCAETWCLLLDPDTLEPLKADQYEIDSRRVGIPSGFGGKSNSVVRSRALIPRWCCYLALDIDDDIVPDPKLVEQVFAVGGRTIGVLDYRPGHGGPFGRFTATLANGVSANGAGKGKRKN